MALIEEMEKQGVWLFRYRSTLPLLALVAAALLVVRTELNPELFSLKETPKELYYELGCLAVGLLGLLIRIYTVGHTPKNTSGRNVHEQVADALNTTGAYSLVRHPLYVGNFFMWLGPAMLTGHVWFIVTFCLAYWIYYEKIMFAEEAFLRRKYGEEYINWSLTVPAFIPNFKNFTKASLPMNWRKIIKRERNGLLALVAIFCAFDVAGELIREEQDYNWIFIYATVASMLAYIVIKLIQKNTDWLVEDRG